jgi:hypothetical protein
MFNVNKNQKKAEVATFIPDDVNKTAKKHKCHHIMLKGSIHQGDIRIIDI